MNYFAHTYNLPDGSRDPNASHWQLLREHLENVAMLAKKFAHEARPGYIFLCKRCFRLDI
jgi:hypothetical protein